MGTRVRLRIVTTERPLFRIASRGVAWSLVTSVAVMAASLVAQLVLGWLLTETDYGVYALALASSDFLAVFRDGGVQLWLSRLTPKEFERIESHAFWLATFCSIASSLLLVCLAFVAEYLYQDRRIRVYLLILAASFPWTAYASVALAKLQVELKFRTMALIKLVSALCRHSCVVLLAYMDFGTLSFALAFVVVTFLELAIYFAVTRISVFVKPVLSECNRIFQQSRWSLGGSFATAVLRQSDYAVLGLFATKDIVGFYFFAYQLAMVPVLLFSESLRRVVVPTFSRAFVGAEKQERSLRYVGTFIGGVAAVGLLGLCVTASPLVKLLWHGRWAKSVLPIQFLCLAMPLHLAAFVVEMIAQSQGKFRLWTTAVFCRGIGFGLAALLAGMCGGAESPALVAAFVAVYVALSAIVEILVLARKLGTSADPLSAEPLFRTMLPPYLIAKLVAIPIAFGGFAFESPIVDFLAKGLGFTAGVLLLWGLFSRATLYSLLEMARKMVGAGESAAVQEDAIQAVEK